MNQRKPAAKMSRDEVIDLAIKNNHTLLYHYCEAYTHGLCSWEEAMQAVAINLSEINNELTKELVNLHMSFPATIKNSIRR